MAVISSGYWERRFGRDPAVIGKAIYLAKIPFTVIGITAPDFRLECGRWISRRCPAYVNATSACVGRPQYI